MILNYGINLKIEAEKCHAHEITFQFCGTAPLILIMGTSSFPPMN
jgi:hypothetical protein